MTLSTSLRYLTLTLSTIAISGCFSGTSPQTVEVEDTPPADTTPMPQADSFTADTGSSGNLFSVLDNDDCDCVLTITAVTDPDGAGASTTSINGNQIEYTPDPALGNSTQQTFSYTVENSDGESATATVTVTLNGDTTPMPVDDTFSVSTGSSNNSFDVLSNDDCDCTLTLTAVTDPDGAGASTTTINGDQIEYTPDPALTDDAQQTFSYSVENEDGVSVDATVTVNLVAGPTANADSLSISKNSPHNPIDVLENDSVSGSGTKSINSFDSLSANGGRVWLSDDASQLVYQPPLNSLEEDSFNYTLSDGTSTASATVTITATDHAPGVRPCESEAVNREAAGRPYCFDVLIPAATDDGHVIAATVFVPADGGASKPPVLMHSHGFGESRFADLENPNAFMVNRVTAQSLLELWHEGYWVVSYDQRGFNASNLWGPSADSSNGQCSQAGDPECIDVLNPEREGRDQVAVVDWVIANLRQGYVATLNPAAATPAFTSPDSAAAALYDDSDGDVVLGTIGLSYGGGFQTIGSSVAQALYGMSRINAMIPVTTWFDIRYSLSPNDVPKSGWIQFLTGATQTGGTTLAPNGFLAGIGQEATALDNVSTESYDGLYLRTPRAYCENMGDDNIGVYADGDTTLQPSLGTTGTPNIPAVFMIQGQRDLLFNYNEALDFVKCYENAGSPDVRLLVQTEGHILPGGQTASYKGEAEVIYIDEEIFCDTEGADKLMTRELISSWFRNNLGAPSVPEAFFGDNVSPPKVCTTHFLTGAAPQTGNSFASFADVPVGDVSGNGSYTFAITDGGDSVAFTLPGGGPQTPLHQQTLITASGDLIISGIPLLNLELTGTGSPSPNDDARFFAKLGVIRSGGNAVEVIADQETPISGAAPTANADCVGGGCPVTYTYPDESRHYPEQVGETIGTMAGISVKLSAGDQLVLQLFDNTNLYNLHGTNPGAYNLTITTGSIQIPVVP